MKLLIVSLILVVSSLAQAQPEFVDSPSACFAKKNYPCSVRVTGSFLSFEREAQKYHLGDRSSVLFVSASEIQLLQGALWVRDSKGLRIKVSPALGLEATGEFFLQKTEGNLLVRNLNGEIGFQSSMVFENESLPVGFQNWYGSISTDGQILRGMIRPIGMGDFLRAWIPVAGAPIAELKKRTLVYKENWKGALELSSQIYQKIVERRIASQEEKALAIERKKQELLREQSQLRQMFREKNGMSGL